METISTKPVWMIRGNLDNLPNFSVPAPFSFRWFQAGDEQVWFGVQNQSDPRAPLAANQFEKAFGANRDALPQRMCFLLDANQKPIGTATAWLDENFDVRVYGRIHWVAIVEDYQGRGLAKPLMSVVCSRLRALGHERACLRTSTHRMRAIHLYMKFGFVPLIRNAEEQGDWSSVLEKLRSVKR